MRIEQISLGEHYHVFNRGNNKQPIFLEDIDKSRFLFTLLFFQGDSLFSQMGRAVSTFAQNQHRVFDIFNDEIKHINQKRYSELINFALMPNHFHLTLCESSEGGISKYMQRTLNSYTKYFNAKYNKTGHLFQGPFKVVHIDTNEQLLHLSAYIHRNPRELTGWHNTEHLFPWSSYQDYVGNNRWGILLKQDLILSQFKNKAEYFNFIKTSGAKNLLDENLLID